MSTRNVVSRATGGDGVRVRRVLVAGGRGTGDLALDGVEVRHVEELELAGGEDPAEPRIVVVHDPTDLDPLHLRERLWATLTRVLVACDPAAPDAPTWCRVGSRVLHPAELLGALERAVRGHVRPWLRFRDFCPLEVAPGS